MKYKILHILRVIYFPTILSCCIYMQMIGKKDLEDSIIKKKKIFVIVMILEYVCFLIYEIKN